MHRTTMSDIWQIPHFATTRGIHRKHDLSGEVSIRASLRIDTQHRYSPDS